MMGRMIKNVNQHSKICKTFESSLKLSFFLTSCPDLCQLVSESEMLRLWWDYERLWNNKFLLSLSRGFSCFMHYSCFLRIVFTFAAKWKRAPRSPWSLVLMCIYVVLCMLYVGPNKLALVFWSSPSEIQSQVWRWETSKATSCFLVVTSWQTSMW